MCSTDDIDFRKYQIKQLRLRLIIFELTLSFLNAFEQYAFFTQKHVQNLDPTLYMLNRQRNLSAFKLQSQTHFTFCAM